MISGLRLRSNISETRQHLDFKFSTLTYRAITGFLDEHEHNNIRHLVIVLPVFNSTRILTRHAVSQTRKNWL